MHLLSMATPSKIMLYSGKIKPGSATNSKCIPFEAGALKGVFSFISALGRFATFPESRI